MNNLRNKVRKAILPACEECEKEIYIDSVGNLIKDTCKTCKGKGYVEELEFGCEIKIGNDADPGFIGGVYIVSSKLPGKDKVFRVCQVLLGGDLQKRVKPELDYENLGKPLTLQEVLLALGKRSVDIEFKPISRTNIRIWEVGKNDFDLPLTLPPEEWPQGLQDKICELL